MESEGREPSSTKEKKWPSLLGCFASCVFVNIDAPELKDADGTSQQNTSTEVTYKELKVEPICGPPVATEALPVEKTPRHT